MTKRRISLGGGGGSSITSRAVVKAAIRFGSRLEAVFRSIKSGVAVVLAPIYAVTVERPAFLFTTRNQGAATPTVKQAATVTNRSAGTIHPIDLAGAKITQIKYDLTQRSGGNAQTSSVSTGSAWTNPNNAIGIHNAGLATVPGEAIAVKTALMPLAYADFPNKSSLTITSVKLHFYTRITNDALSTLATVEFRWGKNGTATQFLLASVAGNHDTLINPRTFDITASIATWADLEALQARAGCVFSAAASLVSFAVDAVELEIVATETDAL